MEFYAPWCGHCRNLQPAWEQAASALKGIVNVAAVDADQEKQLGGEYGVQGFPTIKLFYVDNNGNIKSSDYNGQRSAKDIVTFAADKAKAYALKRLSGDFKGGDSGSGSRGGAGGGSQCGGGGGGSQCGGGGGGGSHYGGGGSQCGGGGGGHGAGGGDFYGSNSDVVSLTDSDFEDSVINGPDFWFVEFYAPWCGHCKNLKPAWEEAASELKGKVKVGAVDCTVHKEACSQFGVQGFPTIKFFGQNKQRPEDFQGDRSSSSIVQFALQKWSVMAPPPEVRELVSQQLFEEECLGTAEGSQPKRVCFIVFLPDLLDTQAAGRNAYIKVLKKTAETFKDKPYSYFWVQGGAQPQLEHSLDVGGFGYPAFVGYAPKANGYITSKTAFEVQHVKEFIESIGRGREAVVKLKTDLGQVADIAPWDGQDAKIELEEEFSLEDILGSDAPSTKEEI